MMTEQRYTVIEICQVVDILPDELTEVVELGMIAPLEPQADWIFDYHALHYLKRACRLRIELELEWSGTAVALTLLDKVDSLEQENAQLKRQLARLLHGSPD